MQSEIIDVIQKNLPAEVSTVLQQRLKDGDEAIDKVRRMQLENRDLVASVARLQGFSNLEDAQAVRELDLNTRAAELTLREALIELKEKHAGERVHDMRGVVADVFKNRSLVHNLAGSIPIPDSSGYPIHQPFNATVTSDE